MAFVYWATGRAGGVYERQFAAMVSLQGLVSKLFGVVNHHDCLVSVHERADMRADSMTGISIAYTDTERIETPVTGNSLPTTPDSKRRVPTS